jgi:type I restriction enzyme S subunit
VSFPAYPSYRDSGVDWLGKVPIHWNLKRLAHYFGERREKCSDTDYPALSVTKGGVVPQLDTAAKTDDGENRKKVLVGDFVINSRSDRKGSSGLSSRDGSVSLINTVLSPNPHIFGPFAHHLFRSGAFQEEYYRYGKGIVADLWSTNFSEMRNILLAIPQHSEQVAIANFLDRETTRIDALIEEQQRLIELLKEKRQAVISHAVTKGLDPTAPMKDSGVEWLGEVPAHWEVAPLKRFLAILSGYAFPSQGFSTSENDQRLLRGINVAVGHTRWDDVVFWPRLEGDGFQAFQLQAGDIVLGMDRPWIGDGLRIAQITEDDLPALLLQRVAALRPKQNILQRFVIYLLTGEAFHHHCVPDMSGVSVPHISPGQIGEFVVNIPPLHEQFSIVEAMDTMIYRFRELIATAETAINILQERRSAVISAAVTGKIDVRGVVDLPQNPEPEPA